MSPAKRRLLLHMLDCGGAWLPEDPIKVHPNTVRRLGEEGLLTYTPRKGELAGAELTAEGRAAIVSDLQPKKDNGMLVRLEEIRARRARFTLEIVDGGTP